MHAVKRELIKRLPNVLIIALKRFDINYNTWTRYKINDYCEFPFEINMKEYSIDNKNESNNNDNLLLNVIACLLINLIGIWWYEW